MTSNPVCLYLLLSGYGLYAVNRNGDKNRWRRLWKLLQHYWVITIPFVLLGCYLRPKVYPGTWQTILENITTYKCTYNTECWFILPFIVLSAMAGYIFKVVNKLNGWISFTISFSINTMAALSIHILRPEFMSAHLYINLIYLVAALQYPLVIGMLTLKYNLLNKTQIGQQTAVLLIIVLFIIRTVTSNIWHIYYLIILWYLLLQVLKNNESCRLVSWLRTLGKHSLNIWMIHSWFCYHLFQEQLYALKYPVVVFAVTLSLSLGISIIVEKLFAFANKISKKQC